MKKSNTTAVDMGNYMLEQKATMKIVAQHFGTSISTVFNNLRVKLPKIDLDLAMTVDQFIKNGKLPEKQAIIEKVEYQPKKYIAAKINPNPDFDEYINIISKAVSEMKQEDFTNPIGMTLKQLATKAGLDPIGINFIAFGKYFSAMRHNDDVLSKLVATKDSANAWRFIKQ